MKRCKVCGTEYETCISCEKNHSWKVHTDTLDHYYLFTVLMAYRVDHDAGRAYNVLRKRGFDFLDTAGYTPSVQALLMEINALAHENSRAKKASVKANPVNTEDIVSDKAAERQE